MRSIISSWQIFLIRPNPSDIAMDIARNMLKTEKIKPLQNVN
jgi:hypothetical protein